MELTKFAFRGKLIASISYIKKAEKSKISILPFICQEKEQIIPKENKGKEKFKKEQIKKEKIGAEISKIENRKIITKSVNLNVSSLRRSIKSIKLLPD